MSTHTPSSIFEQKIQEVEKAKTELEVLKIVAKIIIWKVFY
jgi:hypothetical protein